VCLPILVKEELRVMAKKAKKGRKKGTKKATKKARRKK